MASSKITTSPTFAAADAAMMAPFASTDNPWGWTHYGFYVLDLPQPISYLNANSVIGTAGSHTWNRPVQEQKNPTDCRRDSSLHVSTGGTAESPGGWHYSMYDTADASQAQFTEDGSSLQWTHQGTNTTHSQTGTLKVTQAFPRFTLRGTWSDWQFDLTLTVTQIPAVVTHFARMKKRYEHFSLMAHAEGWIQFRDGTRITSPKCKWPANIEYARSITPQMVSPTRLPLDKMVQDSNFTYQILTVASPESSNGAQNFQILLARTGTRKNGNVSFLWLRSALDENQNAAFPVVMRVVRWQRVSTPDGDTETAVVPAEIEWIVRDPKAESKSADPLIRLTVYPGETEGGSVLWRGKFGAGFNTGCRWTGMYRGRSLLEQGTGAREGYGHVEWVDVEASEKDLSSGRFDSPGGRSQL